MDSPQTPPSIPAMSGNLILSLVASFIYAGVAFASLPILMRKGFHQVEPKSTARTAGLREGLRKYGRGVVTAIGILLASLAWPLIIILATGCHFLFTPGHSCCGLTFAKQLPQQQPSLQQHQSQQLPTPPAPPTPRSDEHNMEAGLLNPAPPALQVPAEVGSVAPPAAPRPGSVEHNLEAGLNAAPPELQSPDMKEIVSEPPPAYMLIGPEGLPPLYDDLVVDVA